MSSTVMKLRWFTRSGEAGRKGEEEEDEMTRCTENYGRGNREVLDDLKGQWLLRWVARSYNNGDFRIEDEEEEEAEEEGKRNEGLKTVVREELDDDEKMSITLKLSMVVGWRKADRLLMVMMMRLDGGIEGGGCCDGKVSASGRRRWIGREYWMDGQGKRGWEVC
ncbi:hypothetical protein TWF481_011222 [Arthrobotrys musiformis]|uniref:Uncharacterized protein n=1 Tax=Arthrobotrys musiformis TaxID=47236 RepID=A0AAV9VYT7_9PEZI